MPTEKAFATQPGLTLKRRLNARPEKVNAAWTDAAQLTLWFGPKQTVAGTVRADMDVRVGGRFRISFKTTDDEHHEIGGVYRELMPNKRLVFSWAWHSAPERESQVTVTLKGDGDGTFLTLRQERLFDQSARDGHERGWSGTLDKLEALFA